MSPARHPEADEQLPTQGASFFRIVLWVVTLALLGMGMVMIASTTLHNRREFAQFEFLIKQTAAVVLGLAVAMLVPVGRV